MYTFIPIISSDSIGNSLSSINLNYEQLDNWLYNIQYSAVNFWQPLIDLYTEYHIDWDKSVSLINEYSNRWWNMTSLVEANSSSWIKPIILFYPGLFPFETKPENIISDIKLWINNNFNATISGNSVYAAGQVCIVHNYFYQIEKNIDQTETITSQTVCYTEPFTVKAKCAALWYETIQCGGSSFPCQTISPTCDQTETISCQYSAPYEPVPNTNNTQATSTMTTKVNIKYVDRRESSLLGTYKFVMKDCSWEYQP